MSEKQYVVHFTSMVIHAADEEEAIARACDFKGGGEWVAEEVGGNVVPINPRPSVFMPDMNVVELPQRPYDRAVDFDGLAPARGVFVGLMVSLGIIGVVLLVVGAVAFSLGWIS